MSSVFLNIPYSGDEYFLRSISLESPTKDLKSIILTNSPRPPTPFPTGGAFGVRNTVINSSSQTKITNSFSRPVVNGSISPKTEPKSVSALVEERIKERAIPKNHGNANLQAYEFSKSLEKERGPTPIPVFS